MNNFKTENLSKSTIYNFIGTFSYLFVLGLIFSLTYINSSIFTDWSSAIKIATFDPNVDSIVKSRFLLSVILYKLVPSDFLDTFLFRVYFSWVMSIICFYIFSAFYKKIVGRSENLKTLATIFFLILVCHYSLVRYNNLYYVYDIFTIAMSMLAFILLTSSSIRIVLVGGLFVVILCLSKETITYILAQALGYWVFILYKNKFSISKKSFFPIVIIIISGIGILVVRQLTIKYVGDDNGINSYFIKSMYEDGVFRIYANFKHLLEGPGILQSIFLLGCGMIFWLPTNWTALNTPTKFILAFSGMLLSVTIFFFNFIELRCYNELVPIIACALMQIINSRK